MKAKRKRTLEAWELELIEQRRARQRDLVELNALAARPFKARVIRRATTSNSKLATTNSGELAICAKTKEKTD